MRKFVVVKMSTLEFPSTWEPQTKNVELVEVKLNSTEWQSISLQFKPMNLCYEIAKIERVQNIPLWKKYKQEKIEVDKNKNADNEKMLFHGTASSTMPLIYETETGFDLQFARSCGKWGKATYFAAEAPISHGYITCPGPVCKLFLCRVLTGKSAILDSGYYTSPPAGFDSINGLQTRYFMVYSNYRAYPEYIISYIKKI